MAAASAKEEKDGTKPRADALLRRCLERMSAAELARELNLSPGTIRRWLDLGRVPEPYVFDFMRVLGQQTDYRLFSAAEKDQFFTPVQLAAHCWTTFLRETDISPSDPDLVFVEPSAGDGSFMNVLPPNSIGLDIEPRAPNIAQADFLAWTPSAPADKSPRTRYIVFGNPPFGLRGHLALRFMDHAAKWADMVCFILPQLFESDGKGAPRKRVKGLHLVFSEKLSGDFHGPENGKTRVNGVFQIWSRQTPADDRWALKSSDSARFKIFSLSDGGTVASTRNKRMIGRCDFYLPSTCFGRSKMVAYDSFEELPGRKGYGVVLCAGEEKSDEPEQADDGRAALLGRIKKIDWASASFSSTNSALNLRTSVIAEELQKAIRNTASGQ